VLDEYFDLLADAQRVDRADDSLDTDDEVRWPRQS
jgi:hypothetical protein